MWLVLVNILNKKSQTADKRQFSSLTIAWELTISHPKTGMLRKVIQGLRLKKWIQLAQGGDQWRVLVNTVKNLWVP